jgi:hypothetical protein
MSIAKITPRTLEPKIVALLTGTSLPGTLENARVFANDAMQCSGAEHMSSGKTYQQCTESEYVGR